MSIIAELKARDVFNNVTSEEKFEALQKIIKGSSRGASAAAPGVYIGFDPTAPSLHLGNYIQIVTLQRFKEYGFKPYAVLGGATGMIGDPSGKSEERNLLDVDTLNANVQKIRKQLTSFGFEVVNNIDFYKKMTFLDFLREVGKHINISYMINKDIVKNRLETGISFTEFSYQLIQGWDFKNLYEKHNVHIQVGGSDQWGNITTGIELIRKVLGDNNTALGITTNLLTTSSGKKFGKSEGNAIWIDKQMSSPFALYQYLLNTSDEDVERLLLWTTFLTPKAIEKVMAVHNRDRTQKHAQKLFAETLVHDIHGASEVAQVLNLSQVLFGGRDVRQLTPSALLQLRHAIPTFYDLTGTVKEVLLAAGVATSNRELREFIAQGALTINGEHVADENAPIDRQAFGGQATLIKRGKHNHYLVVYQASKKL